jgi:tape measure domain-containing protein
MATDVERLLIRLEASASKFERDMDRARGVAARRTREIEQSFEGLKSGVVKIGASLGAAVVAALSIDQIKKAADTYTSAVNQIKVAGTAAADVPRVFDELFASAQRNAVPVEALAQLYGRVSQAQATLKVSSGDVLQMTEIVAQSLRVSGASAESASGALLQLAQALSGGTVQAEEWNSLLDGMYPLLQAAASGIKEAGGDVATLTRLVKDGEVSSKALFEGIRAGSGVLKDKLADSTLTVAQATTKMTNEMTRAIGEFDRLVGVAPTIVSSMDLIGRVFADVALSAAVGTKAIIDLINAIASASKSSATFNQNPLNEQLRQPARDRASINAQLRERENAGADRAMAVRAIDRMVGPVDAPAFYPIQGVTGPVARPKDTPPSAGLSPNAISLKDYAPTGAKTGGGGGGGSAAEKVSDYERQIEALRKKTEMLRVEAEVMEQGNAAVERAKIVRELELAAKKAGVAESEAVKAAIQKEADAHMAVKKTIEEKTQSMEAMRELQQLIGSSMASFFSDVVSGGKNASDALMNLTKKLAEAALQATLLGQGPLAGLFGTAGKNGAVGGIIGALFKGFSFGGFKAAGGPVGAGRAYVVGERGPEIFVPPTAGKIVPNRALSGGSGGRPSVTIVQHIAANGDRTIAQIARQAAGQAIAQYDAGLLSNVAMKQARMA